MDIPTQWILVGVGLLQLFQAAILVVAGVAWRAIWHELTYQRRKIDAVAQDVNRLLGAHDLEKRRAQ